MLQILEERENVFKEEISHLKTQLEEARRTQEEANNQMKGIKEKCEALNAEANFARDELKRSGSSAEASTSITRNVRSNVKKENHQQDCHRERGESLDPTCFRYFTPSPFHITYGQQGGVREDLTSDSPSAKKVLRRSKRSIYKDMGHCKSYRKNRVLGVIDTRSTSSFFTLEICKEHIRSCHDFRLFIVARIYIFI